MIGFGNYTKKADATAITKKADDTTITTLADKRLVKIDPQEDAFFDTVLNFKSRKKDMKKFIEAIHEVKGTNIGPFYKPIYDPSEGENTIIYEKGRKPAIGHSYNWWVETASKMPAVNDRHWHLATEYQYYTFLVWLINQLVKSGKSVEKALNMVVYDSTELGHYCNSEDSTEGKALEFTGSRCVCEVYDLANILKILSCSNEEDSGFWLVGGNCFNSGHCFPLADICYCTRRDFEDDYSLGLLVL